MQEEDDIVAGVLSEMGLEVSASVRCLSSLALKHSALCVVLRPVYHFDRYYSC